MFTKNFFASLAGTLQAQNNGNPLITLYDSAGSAYTAERAGMPGSSSQYKQCLSWYSGISDTPSTYGPCKMNVIHNGSKRFFGSTGQNNTNIAGCVILGDGNTPPTIDDVALSGNMITTFEATTAVTISTTNGVTLMGIYTITNTGASDITIREIALTRCGMTGDNIPTSPLYFLMERSVLETPITITPGSAKSVVYRINMFETA